MLCLLGLCLLIPENKFEAHQVIGKKEKLMNLTFESIEKFLGYDLGLEYFGVGLDLVNNSAHVICI